MFIPHRSGRYCWRCWQHVAMYVSIKGSWLVVAKSSLDNKVQMRSKEEADEAVGSKNLSLVKLKMEASSLPIDEVNLSSSGSDFV
ncbi:hypothetical protein U1Q18_038919 [Sarracenia purpurea var. burkii]